MQVFLDRENFGPGKIDAEGGEFTKKAILRYQQAHGLKADGNVKSLPIDQDLPGTIDYTVTAEDLEQIGPVPEKPEEQAKLKALPYGSVSELLAEKFHASEKFLKELNPQLKGNDLKSGDVVKVPNVKPFDMAAVEAKRTKEEASAAKESAEGAWLDVDVAEEMLEVKEGEKILAAFPITPGSSSLPAPKGNWHIETINYMPVFRFDKEMLYHGRRGENGVLTPPGPNNSVGVMWMSINKKGIGIHGTNEPETIGRAASHGCIRLANWDAVRVAAMIKPGARVVIR
ncbi:MAG: murein L,D-transpeptidase [Chthoniobacteraceae bacterium]|nr:murein L,D-transpeptidase [Chthoniobacteraceae bacterium]